MDMVKIGNYLRELRKEKGLTQEQLGERLGVTNKTVSRWETGTYLPPVECLELLSDMYGLTINEILNAAPLDDKSYKQAAEENIKAVLKQSAFTANDRLGFFRKKWKKDHLIENIVIYIALFACIAAAAVFYRVLVIPAVLAVMIYNRIDYNRMMAYSERKAFENTDK